LPILLNEAVTSTPSAVVSPLRQALARAFLRDSEALNSKEMARQCIYDLRAPTLALSEESAAKTTNIQEKKVQALLKARS